MTRLRFLLAVVLPSMFAGALVLGVATSRADDGHATGSFWPANDHGILLAQAPTPPTTPTPPTPPTPPPPTTPPTHRHHHKHKHKHSTSTSTSTRTSVVIHDGKVEIDGVDIKQLVDGQLRQALAQLQRTPGIPDAVRAQMMRRLAKVNDLVDRRLDQIDIDDLEQLGEELGEMGDEIGLEMEGFGSDMDRMARDLQTKVGKDLANRFRHLPRGAAIPATPAIPAIPATPAIPAIPAIPATPLPRVTPYDDADDADDDLPDAADASDDDARIDSAAADLGDLALQPAQRAELARLRGDADKQIAAARQQLDRLEHNLRAELEDPSASDAEVSRQIDAVAAQEAAIRKVRVMEWMNARRVLDRTQRARLERVVPRGTK